MKDLIISFFFFFLFTFGNPTDCPSYAPYLDADSDP